MLEPSDHPVQWVALVAVLLALLAGLRVALRWRGVQFHWRRALADLRRRPGRLGRQLALTVGPGTVLGLSAAIALGGVGAVGWLWLLSAVTTALRVADHAAPQRSGPPPWSAAGHPARGGVVVWLVVVVLWAGLHVVPSAQAFEALLPASWPWALGAALLGAGLLLFGPQRAAPYLGAVALLGLLGLLVGLGLAVAAEPAVLASVPGRVLGEMLDGSAPAPPFVGATAGEVLRLAWLRIGPPLLASTGLLGSAERAAEGSAAAGPTASALELPVLWLLGFLFAAAVVATGALFEPVDTTRPLAGLLVYRGGFETPSQRLEPERRHRGYMRVRDGKMVDVPLRVGDWQGTFQSARFEVDGAPADFALHLDERGRPIRLLLPGEQGALQEAPLSRLQGIVVRGRHLPDGPGLLAEVAARSVAPDAARLLLWVALFAWLAACGGVFGLGLLGLLPSRLAGVGGRGVAVVAIGVGGLAALPQLRPWTEPLLVVASGLALCAAVVASWSLAARRAGRAD